MVAAVGAFVGARAGWVWGMLWGAGRCAACRVRRMLSLMWRGVWVDCVGVVGRAEARVGLVSGS
jgi:hypothetical protein